jgi:hypothetical protein
MNVHPAGKGVVMMIRNTTRRKSEIRIHEVLPNGQHFNFYFWRKHNANGIFTQWQVALRLSKSRKEANLWFNNYKRRDVITGDGSIVGLRRALHYILKVSNHLGQNEELIVSWSDSKRASAYRYLKRYGFMDYKDDDGTVTGYGIRNPEYWNWNEDTEI